MCISMLNTKLKTLTINILISGAIVVSTATSQQKVLFSLWLLWLLLTVQRHAR